jgi:hypothetical protein
MNNKEVFLSLASVLMLIASSDAQAAPTTSSDPYHLPNGTTTSNNSTLIAAGMHFFDWLYASNPTATGAYIHMFNTSVSPPCTATALATVGSTGITHVFPIPPNWGGFVIPPTLNEQYGVGLGFCVTALGTDGDNTSAVSGIFIEGGYR